MADNRDVYEDNTAGSQRANEHKTSPATSFGPGEKPFKEKKGGQGHGYSHVPGAGENPGKIGRD